MAVLFFAVSPTLSAMQGTAGLGMEQMKKAFFIICMFVHGYASILANNSLKYDEEVIKEHLTRAYRGAILATQDEIK